MVNPIVHAEVRDLMAQLRTELSADQPVAPAKANLILEALEQTLAFPAVTRDMVSRGHVVGWLESAALPALRQAAGGDAS